MVQKQKKLAFTVRLGNEHAKRFLRIKEKLALESNSEVIRFLLKKYEERKIK